MAGDIFMGWKVLEIFGHHIYESYNKDLIEESLKDILTINHSPDLTPYYFYLFGQLHSPMKRKLYADIEDI